MMLAAGPALAQVGVADVDGDGVADQVDSCSDTPEGDLVGPDGCSVCPCEATAWDSHQDYVRCVATEVQQRRVAGRLRRREARSALRRARRSTCGNTALTRCCVYQTEDDDTGSCRLMSPDACDALDESGRVDSADDEGAGSCMPDTCTF